MEPPTPIDAQEHPEPCFVYAPIELDGGWRAEVLIACEPPADIQGSAEAWRVPLAQLTAVFAGFSGRPSRSADTAYSPPRTRQPQLADTESPEENLRDFQVLKHSATVQVLRSQVNVGGHGIDVVCKLNRPSRWRRRLQAPWTGSRARRNRSKALALLKAGVGTALPLAVVESRLGRYGDWIITKTIADAVDLDHVALALLPQLEPRRARTVKDALIPPLARVFVRLARHGLRHRDLKASNLLVTGWDGSLGEPRFWIVDLDGLRRRPLAWAGSKSAAPSELARLAASLLTHGAVTRTDALRFLQQFLAESGVQVSGWTDVFRTLSTAAEHYARRSLARKRGKIDGFAGA